VNEHVGYGDSDEGPADFVARFRLLDPVSEQKQVVQQDDIRHFIHHLELKNA